MSYGYLGPVGTFSEQAAKILSRGAQIKPYHSIWEVLDAVNSGAIEFGIVPIENSTEGMVNTTVDSLMFDTDLYIKEMLIMPIIQNIMAKEGTNKEDITDIYSHPQALAQCRHFLQDNFPKANIHPINSTAEAAKLVSQSNKPVAAISPENSAELYGLNIIESSIQDSDINFTEFVLVSRDKNIYPKFGEQTTICFSTVNEPGSLYKLLDIFSIWDVNMIKIVSRPMRNKPMEYVFYIELDNKDDEEDMIDALKMIERKTSFFKNLGSYPLYDCR